MKTMYFEPAIEHVRRCKPMDVSQLDKDLEVLMRGDFPSRRELVTAPVLDLWLTLFVPPQRVQLAGFVSGHPIRRNGLVVTSPLCAIDCQTFRWARTASRYYRLLNPLRGVRFDG